MSRKQNIYRMSTHHFLHGHPIRSHYKKGKEGERRGTGHLKRSVQSGVLLHSLVVNKFMYVK